MLRITTLIILAALTVSGPGAADDMITIGGRETVIDSPETSEPVEAFFSGRAKEPLLRLEREKPYALPKAALAADHTDTIKIIAFRIGFAYETVDEPLTTGRGTFDYRDSATFVNEEGHWLDPAPRNRHYFESHLRSLSHYWEVVSDGRLFIEYEVWPQDDTGYYQLAEPMAYYGQQPPNFGLGEFFHDALNLAYDIDGDNFELRDVRGNKKAIMLFHAGADRQTDLSFSATPTPYDLYTGFATFDGGNQVILGADTIVEGTIMPETMAQDNRVSVMNAVMAHEFGHQLGLIDLYNTGSSPFLSQMGDFALMDNNGMNTAAYIDEYGTGAFGTVPIFPCAWSRAFLGFEEVVEYREGTAIELAAVKMEDEGVKIVKIPISETEYYLLENRRGDLDGNLDGLRVDSTSNVVLWPVRLQQILEGDSIVLIKIPVPEYDVYIPDNASGIAVWHVDEAVAAMDYFPFDIFPNNFEANTLQWDPNRRFIRLIEADGVIDFGGNYARGFGKAVDLFYTGNNGSLGSYTNPASLTNSEAYSHVNISNISEPGMVMTFDVGRDIMADDFPRRIGMPVAPDRSPVVADIDADGIAEILVVSDNRIMAVSATGADFMDPLDSLPDIDTIYSAIGVTTDVNIFRPGDTVFARLPVFGEVIVGDIVTDPIVATFNDTTVVMVGTDNGWIYTFLPYSTASSSPAKYRADLHSVRSATSGDSVKAIIPDEDMGLVHVIFANGVFISFPWDYSGTLTEFVHDFGYGFSGACRYGRGLALLFDRDATSVLYMTRDASLDYLADSLVADSVIIVDGDLHAPVAADFDRDGNDDVVIVSRMGQVRSYSFMVDGITANMSLDIFTGDTAVTGPVVGDADGDGFPELFVPGTNRLYGYDREGYVLADFPLEIDYGRPGQVIIAGPILSDINGDGLTDYTVVTMDSIPRDRSVWGVYYYTPDPENFPDSVIVVDTLLEYSYYNYFNNVYAVTSGGRSAGGFPVPVGVFGMRSLGDTVMNAGVPAHMPYGDGGLLISCGADGWLDAWTCGWSDAGALWPMKGRTASQSAWLPVDSLSAVSAAAELLPESRFYNYPNPATGDATTIRFYVNQAATVKITIFDALGDAVETFERAVPEGNRVEEILWQLGDVASGVYHCRLEATASSGTESQVAFKTIAVVR